MQEDFNQENINPDLDQETSDLGIDLTLDSEENQVQDIETDDSAFNDLDFLSKEEIVNPYELDPKFKIKIDQKQNKDAENELKATEFKQKSISSAKK